MIQVKDKSFELFIPAGEIQARIREMALSINHDLQGKNPVFLCVLNGALFFTADLLKNIDLPCTLSCIKLRSYEGTSSTGTIHIDLDIKENLEGKDLIIIEDIIDTGTTLQFLREHLQKFNPASVRIASLFLKPAALKHNLKADYIGFEIDNKFIVGYGLDYDGLGRNLEDVYQLANNLQL